MQFDFKYDWSLKLISGNLPEEKELNVRNI